MTPQFKGVPFKPRRGNTARVMLISRISTVHQSAMSLDDQEAYCRKFVADHYSGPVEFTVIKGRGSGEHLERVELLQAEEGVESKAYDIVVVEDLSRICRRSRAFDFCESCIEHGTRLISINDGIDTAFRDWLIKAGFATIKNEVYNQDTSDRIRRTLRNRFSNGGIVQTVQFGFEKMGGSNLDKDLQKLPGAERIYEKIFTMLEGGATYSEVADWMNSEGVPVGKWSRNRKWDGRMVSRLVHNPLVKGLRRRNEMISVRKQSGVHFSVKAPKSENLSREVLHLAFIEPVRYDRLIATLAARNGHYARGRAASKDDSRKGVSKRHTLWPGQSIHCGVCGRLFYWGGHGVQSHMMCAGARDYQCWVATTFDGELAGKKLISAFLTVLESLPDFDADFRRRVEAAAAERSSGRDGKRRALEGQIASAQTKCGRLACAIESLPNSASLLEQLETNERNLAIWKGDLDNLERQPDEVPPLPSIDEIKRAARARVEKLDFRDRALQRSLHTLMPRIEVLPYRVLGGRRIVLRARVTIALTALLDSAFTGLPEFLARTILVDLFDPPQIVAYLDRIVAGTEAGKTQHELALELGLTVTAVSNAKRLHRSMQAAGLTDPYVALTAPWDGGRISRHTNARYKFEPMEGYPAIES
jgi:DNA invertase Pin-like site-specific DNA recombinase